MLADLDPLDAARVAERAAADVGAALVRPVPVGTELVHISGSVGIALLPDDGSTGAALMLAADSAMYATKQSRRLPAPRGAGGAAPTGTAPLVRAGPTS